MNQFDLINNLVNDHLTIKPATPAATPLKLAEPMSTGEEREIQYAVKDGLISSLERTVAIIALMHAVDRLISAGHIEAAKHIMNNRDTIARNL